MSSYDNWKTTEPRGPEIEEPRYEVGEEVILRDSEDYGTIREREYNGCTWYYLVEVAGECEYVAEWKILY